MRDRFYGKTFSFEKFVTRAAVRRARRTRGKLIFAICVVGCREKTTLHKTLPTTRTTFPRRRQWTRARARRVTPHGARGREEKWRVLATSRREKRGRAFLRKVGREGIRLYTTRRARPDRSPRDARGRGVVDDDAGRLLPPPPPPSRRPCLKARAR